MIFNIDVGRDFFRIPRKHNIFTATAIFLKDDVNTDRYFQTYKKEIDKITGAAITVFLAKQVECGDASAVTRVFDGDSPEAKRFPKLRRGDLPCLWLEDIQGKSAILKISENLDNAKQILRILADQAEIAQSANDLKRRVEAAMRGDLQERDPFVARLMEILEKIVMFNLPNDKVAIVSGGVFIVTMLVIALFVPQPSPFQYFVFRSVLSISAAAFATAIPGILNINMGNWLKAGGALAVLVLVYLVNPASLVVK